MEYYPTKESDNPKERRRRKLIIEGRANGNECINDKEFGHICLYLEPDFLYAEKRLS
jgi:hypothetical protein